MSYDLQFGPGTEEHAFAGDEDPEPTLPNVHVWQRVVDRAERLLGPVQAVLTDAYGELDHGPTGIRLVLTARTATIGLAYGSTGDEAATALRQMFGLGHIVEEETGLTGYDPQVGQPLRVVAEDLSRALVSFDLVGDMLRRRTATERRIAERRAEKERGNG